MSFIFSICIPTFNRAHELRATLASIVQQDAFDNDIEIVVIDNASSDLTQSIAQRFAGENPNIVYRRNSENIGASANVLQAAFAGSGRYIKLLNDNKVLNSGVIHEWRLLYSDANEDVIFHYPGRANPQRDTEAVVSTDQFAYALCHLMTWLGGISFKHEALARIDPESVDRSSCIPQTELMLRLLGPGPARIVYSNWFVETKLPVRAGYNYFEVFNRNFPHLLDHTEAAGCISRRTKRHIERRLLVKHTFPFILNSVIDRHHYGQKRDGAFFYLVTRFYSFPELYLFPFWVAWFGARSVFRKIRRLI